jgi:hypothetical protein
MSHRLWLLVVLSKLAFQKGMKLPGSRPDVLRTKSLSGPSPVGGAFGGTESQNVMTLDDFELQAAHYNMACAHARLGNLNEVRSRKEMVGACGKVGMSPHNVFMHFLTYLIVDHELRRSF